MKKKIVKSNKKKPLQVDSFFKLIEESKEIKDEPFPIR